MCEARNFTAYVDEICGTRREIWGAALEDKFRATRRRNKIYGVKYYAEFYSAARRDKILDIVLANVRNSGLKNACVNLRPRNTYADLKFKGSTNSEPANGINFKFKNGASFRFLCDGNTKPIKSNGSADALNSSGANKILASIWAGRILSFGISAMDLVFDAAAKNFISSSAARILSFSVEAGILASSLANKILNPSAMGKILSLSAASRTGADFGLKGAGGC